MRPEILSSMLARMVRHKPMRSFLARKIDHAIEELASAEVGDLEPVRRRRYEYLSAMLRCMVRAMDRGTVSPHVVAKIVEVFVRSSLVGDDEVHQRVAATYEARYGEGPPTFIVVSPTQRCNLRCTGCYADSSAQQAATLPYNLLDRVLGEAHDLLGCRFITVSGGEPFLYRSENRTLLDLYDKYRDIFFQVYTNGTLIDESLAQALATLGNVTPAVSVEGFEVETDHRRGPGTFRRILGALENLRIAGVPFGISVTATRENLDLLLSDRFYDFYFAEQGACYMWMFQLMPIGRGQDELDLMVSPEQRVQLFRQWERMLGDKRYCVADFWNSGVLSRGCVAYGRSGGYIYVDWHGHVTPCVFIPYYVDTLQDLYAHGKTLADALFSPFMVRGRQWQREYGLDHANHPHNWLMPCSIRDHYEVFRQTILTTDARPQDVKAYEALQSNEFLDVMRHYDQQLEALTSPIWDKEYLHSSPVHQETAL